RQRTNGPAVQLEVPVSWIHQLPRERLRVELQRPSNDVYAARVARAQLCYGSHVGARDRLCFASPRGPTAGQRTPGSRASLERSRYSAAIHASADVRLAVDQILGTVARRLADELDSHASGRHAIQRRRL